mmetsp:Transcript_25014/g.34271  ORF Transcript_25014/g.34271 Transcript_25014/m.34271 type:complete len:205 (-) Transcript_25014:729-1343(-)
MMKLSIRMSPEVVQISTATAPIFAMLCGALSSKKFGFGICFAFQGPLYSGLSIIGALHFPLYSGFSISGLFHSPQPETDAHFGLDTMGASHSPSSSSSQSSGTAASGSGTKSGSESSQSFGFSALASGIFFGASSSQSSGLDASGSLIFFVSTQSDGFESVGSSISAGGFTAGFMSSKREPLLFDSRSTKISKELSVLMARVYT